MEFSNFPKNLLMRVLQLFGKLKEWLCDFYIHQVTCKCQKNFSVAVVQLPEKPPHASIKAFCVFLRNWCISVSHIVNMQCQLEGYWKHADCPSLVWVFHAVSPLPCSPANKQPEIAPRRTGTINKKQHSTPNFQPPLPPIEAGGGSAFEPCPQSPAAGLEVLQTQQTLVQQNPASDNR